MLKALGFQTLLTFLKVKCFQAIGFKNINLHLYTADAVPAPVVEVGGLPDYMPSSLMVCCMLLLFKSRSERGL